MTVDIKKAAEINVDGVLSQGEMPQNKNLTQINLSEMMLTMQEKKALRREISKRYKKTQSGQEKARSQGQKPYQAGKPPEKQISVRTYPTDANKKPGSLKLTPSTIVDTMIRGSSA